MICTVELIIDTVKGGSLLNIGLFASTVSFAYFRTNGAKKKYSIMKFNTAGKMDFTKMGPVSMKI